MTEEKIEKYLNQSSTNIRLLWRIKGLVECPVCEKVVTISEWSEHRWREKQRRSKNPKPIFKNKLGVYN